MQRAIGMKRRANRAVTALILLFCLAGVANAQDPTQKAGSDYAIYKEAKQAIYQKEWSKAVTRLTGLKNGFTGSSYFAEALYWLAYSQYKLGRSTHEAAEQVRLKEEALKNLDELIANHTPSDWTDDAEILRIKVCLDLVNGGRQEYRARIQEAAEGGAVSGKDVQLVALAALEQLAQKAAPKEPKPIFLPEQHKPEMVHEVKPKYPAVAKTARVQGKVIVEVTIDSKGKPIQVKIFKGHPLLNSTALRAVEKSRYKPYVKDGRAVPVTFFDVVEFVLH